MTSTAATSSHAPDWDVLRAAARQAALRAHAPHSQFPVGAAGWCEDGTIVLGCNVENAAYTGLHAEWGVVGAATVGGHGRIIALALAGAGGCTPSPCGGCRQVLMEHSGGSLLVDDGGVGIELATLLPGAFTSADLHHGGGQ